MAPGLLAVHAHADDETITMGGTFAHYASLGVRTANVCCTDGRLATIVDPTMVEEEVRPRLGEVRHAELTEACAILGVGELHWLGYHDSGMEGAASNREPDSFWTTPLDGIVERLVGIIRDFRPDVVVTYDAHGAYGHPDHVQAHRATLLAVEAAQHARFLLDLRDDPAAAEARYPGAGFGFGADFDRLFLCEYVAGNEYDVDAIIFDGQLVDAWVTDNGVTDVPCCAEVCAMLPSALPAVFASLRIFESL